MGGTMIAMGFDAPGGPEVFRAETLLIPEPGDGEVLIRVDFSGVNRPDVIQRQGNYPPPPGASPLPGLEVSGEIVAVGPGVSANMVGHPVCALTNGGGYAEYCVAPVGSCLPVPEGLSMEEAAALPETLFTVWHNVFERGYARDGETILVHGGTSGIGTMATKLCKLFGLTVITTCGSDAKCADSLATGADHSINYRTADFVEQVKEVTDKKGADLILDMVAGDYTQRNLDCLAMDGRLVTIATLGGPKAEINVAKLMVKRQTLTGSTLRARSDRFKALLAQEIAENAWPLVADGVLRPVMDRVFPLEQVADAHSRMEAGDHFGKIVLKVQGRE